MKVTERVVLSREADTHLCHGEVGNDAERSVSTGPPATGVSGRQGLGWGGRAERGAGLAGGDLIHKARSVQTAEWDDGPGIRGV